MLKKRLGLEAIEESDWSLCESFKIPSSLIIPDGCKKIGDTTFCGCKNLRKVEIPESVEVIGHYAFWGCKNTTIIVGPWNRIKDIGKYAFKDCIVKYVKEKTRT